MSDFRTFAPSSWNEHWDSMPNATRALYATFGLSWFPLPLRTVRIEGWGQLGNGSPTMVAYHMWNHGMRRGWKFLLWRAEQMDGSVRTGKAPADFSVERYGPSGNKHSVEGNCAN